MFILRFLPMFFRGVQPAGGVVRSCVESFQGLCRCRGVQPAGGVVRSCVERCKELCRCRGVQPAGGVVSRVV